MNNIEKTLLDAVRAIRTMAKAIKKMQNKIKALEMEIALQTSKPEKYYHSVNQFNDVIG